MSQFQWNGNVYPMPEGWAGLEIEEWFYRLESVRDRLMHADEEDLEPIDDEDGDPLDPEEVLLIRVFGFRDGGHWEAFRGWGVYSWASHTGQDPTDLEFRLGGMARERIMREKAGAMTGQGGGGGGLDPVEGVPMDQWAYVQASLAGGGDIDQLIASMGMDRPKWDRVSAVWMQRMTTDTSGAIATAYGNAFAGASQGQYGAQAASVWAGTWAESRFRSSASSRSRRRWASGPARATTPTRSSPTSGCPRWTGATRVCSGASACSRRP